MSHASVARQEWGPRPVTRVKKAGTLVPRVVRAVAVRAVGAIVLAIVGAIVVVLVSAIVLRLLVRVSTSSLTQSARA